MHVVLPPLFCCNISLRYMTFMLAIAKPFLSSKLKKRIHVWGDDFTKLHALLPLSALPQDFGGTAPFSSEKFFMSLK
jgi:hypothetical protein